MSFIAGGFLGWHEKSIRVPALLESQQTVDQQACVKVQQLTRDENDKLQKNLDSISGKLAALRLQHPKTSVRVSQPSSVSDGGPEHAGSDGNGISSGFLRDYAAEAEQYRTEVMVCKDFLAQERQLSK